MFNLAIAFAIQRLRPVVLLTALAIPGLASGEDRHPVTMRLEKLAGQLAESKKSDAEVVDAMHLAALSRFPTEDEKAVAVAFLGKALSRAKALDDLVWAITNAKEYHELHSLKPKLPDK